MLQMANKYTSFQPLHQEVLGRKKQTSLKLPHKRKKKKKKKV